MKAMKEIACGKLWGGNSNINDELFTSGIDASIFSKSASGEKGGDIYYFSVCDSDVLSRVVLADLVGHGDEVSHLSEIIYKYLDLYKNNSENGKLFFDLNNAICELGVKLITTAVVISYNTYFKKFSYVYAGHPPAFFLKKNSPKNTWESANLIKQDNLKYYPLGVIKNNIYQENSLDLNSGDRIFIYTDGLIETPQDNNKENFFGEERLIDFLNKNREKSSHEIKNLLVSELIEFASLNLTHDDTTFLSLEIKNKVH